MVVCSLRACMAGTCCLMDAWHGHGESHTAPMHAHVAGNVSPICLCTLRSALQTNKESSFGINVMPVSFVFCLVASLYSYIAYIHIHM